MITSKRTTKKFNEAHQEFIQDHLSKRTGERRSRLERGHAHAEQLALRNIWWPLIGNFDNLHPEYEIRDWRGYSYFADFAWITPYTRLIIEIKGYRAHVTDMDRNKFSNELNRETFLYAMGFHVISFSYDDVESRPDLCIRLLRMVMSRFVHMHQPVSIPSLAEKEIIRYALRHAGEIRPIDVRKYFNIDYRTAARLLERLSEKEWLVPIYGPDGRRIIQYQLDYNTVNYLEFF